MTHSSVIDQLHDHSKAQVAAALHTALQSLAADSPVTLELSAIYSMLERPPESHLGDYALPCFRIAKELKRKPQDVAAELSQALLQGGSVWIEKVVTAGPFLNIHVKASTLAEHLVPAIMDGSLFQRNKRGDTKLKVMIEYSQPNTHKSFHVGHMRNLVLGDSIGRIYKACGFPTMMVNYIGDEGAHIAKCLWYIQKSGETLPSHDQGEWLGRMYSNASILLEDASAEVKAAMNTEISAVLRDIESKKGATYELWKTTRQWSVDDFNDIYTWTGAHFDHWFTESEVSEESQEIVDEYLKKGIFVESDGAIGLDLKEEKLGFVILRKRDGNTTYATKDLALARRKFSQFHTEKAIIVVASEQNLHFKQVFRTLDAMGFPQAKNCYHLSYGMVVLPDGKMSSRKGNVILFSELKERLEEELAKYLAKYQGEWSEDEIRDATHKLATGTIRYGMVCSDPVKDVVFNLQDWADFEGNTGPYLMYAYARTKSILRKAMESGVGSGAADFNLIVSPEEKDVLRYLNDLNNVILQASESYKPSLICHHLFNMCKANNRSLAVNSVLKAESAELRSARILLMEAFASSLKYGLSLLGIEPPERM
ncbi:MAG: arginine--tRNA ligase [Bdellovibrionota bacterium]